MGGGGGKGSQETKTTMEPPAWMTPYLKDALAQGQKVAEMGYVPYIGPDVAAFNPQQIAGMQQSADMAQAFGLAPHQNVSRSIPKPQTFAGGIQGYSSFPMYSQAQDELAKKYPGLADYLRSFSVDPQTGLMPGQKKGSSFFGGGGGSGSQGGGFGGYGGYGGYQGGPGAQGIYWSLPQAARDKIAQAGGSSGNFSGFMPYGGWKAQAPGSGGHY
jgi:hypothetical protein